MATVGVLCARVRVEAMQWLPGLAEAAALRTPLRPANVPLPVGPSPIAPMRRPPAPPSSMVGAAAEGGGLGEAAARVIVDRCQDRAMAAAILAACRALGATTMDAGLAATGDRLAVATALAAVGLPRPETRLACSEDAAIAALEELGYPGTLLPLAAGTAPVALLDVDTAEAVLEHRSVLGSTHESLALVQAGAPAAAARTTIVVVDGQAVAATPSQGAALASARAAALRLAESVAAVLGAVVVGVEIALTGDGPVVWDVQAVPEYRHAVPLGNATVAEALAAAAVARLGLGIGRESGRDLAQGVEVAAGSALWKRENGRAPAKQRMSDGVALSA